MKNAMNSFAIILGLSLASASAFAESTFTLECGFSKERKPVVTKQVVLKRGADGDLRGNIEATIQTDQREHVTLKAEGLVITKEQDFMPSAVFQLIFVESKKTIYVMNSSLPMNNGTSGDVFSSGLPFSTGPATSDAYGVGCKIQKSK